jgi:hypothetical protein
MKALSALYFSAAAIALGFGAAWLCAPAFHRHEDPRVRLVPMWASNPGSLNAMTASAEAVVVARVEQTMLGRTVPTTDEHVLPFTYVDLAVERVIAGSAPSHITLEQTGGQLDDLTVFASGDGGPYEPGEQVLLFLEQQPDTGLYYLVHPKGRFLVADGLMHAVMPEDPVARMLDLRPVNDVQRLIRR